MPRPSRLPPYPKKAHKSGQARIRIFGKDEYLGVWGSEESHARYAQLAQEFAARQAGRSAPPPADPKRGPTVGDLIAAWHKDACERIGKDNKEVREILGAATVLDRKFGKTPARDFDANRLELVRDAMIAGDWMTPAEIALREKRKIPLDWSRNHVNHQISRIKKIFRWGERKKFVEKGTWEHLRSLSPLPKQAGARKNRRREACDWEAQVKPVLPLVPPQVRAMILLQVHGGMRPGEVVAIRPANIRRDGPGGSWVYEPEAHKGDWRDSDDGLRKVLGTEAQKVLLPWLEACDGNNRPIFRPNRKCRHGGYTTAAYSRSITRACKEAKVKPWFPYALRHLAKKLATQQFGLDAARAFLGQTSLEATNGYSRQIDLESAAEVANKLKLP